MKKGLILLMLAGLLACVSSGKDDWMQVQAAEVQEESVQAGYGTWVNPLYVPANIAELPAELQEDAAVPATGSGTYSSKKAAAAYIKRQMRERQESISFYYQGSGLSSETVSALQEELLQLALEVTTCPQEGDYLRYHIASIGYSYTYSWEGTETYIVWNVSYMTNAQEERLATAAVKSKVKALKLAQDSDAVKIKKIHDAICEQVVYVNDGSLKVHSAYGAVSQGQAVCQGYATLFYAMGLEAGLKVRCVQGTANGGPHLWNIVKLRSKWYNIDVTWDDQQSGIYYNFFLKNNADFGNHISSQEYSNGSFFKQHPIAKQSYTGKVEKPVLKSVVSAGANSLKLKWSKVPSAAGYRIYAASSKNGAYKKLSTLKGGVTSKTVSGLVPGKKYYFKICAYGDMFDKTSSAYSGIKAAKPLPAKVTVKGVSASKGALRVTWKKVQGAAGYQVIVSYKSGKKTINKQVYVKANKKSSQSAKIKGLPSGKKCSVSVRAYATGAKGKVFGTKSSAVKKTVK